jgi:cephalosporin hydroxylase
MSLSKEDFANKLKNALIKHSVGSYTDKASYHAYEEFYPEHLQYLLNKKEEDLHILEIGSAYGGSLHSWMDVLPNANFYSIDYNFDNLCEYVKTKPNFKMYKCNQSDPIIQSIFPNIKFDLIIDDASHQINDQMTSFNYLKDRLNSNSKYIIEDIYPEHVYPDDFLQNFEIFDLTKIKNRSDDKLFVYNKV